MADVPLLPGFCSVTAGVRMAIAAEDTAVPDFEPLVQQVTRVVNDPWVVMDGRVEDDSAHGGRIDFDGGTDSYTVYDAAPMPEDLDLGTWRRWLPRPAWLTAPAAGGRRWWPIETDPGNMVASGVGTSGVPEPRVALYTSVDPATGSHTGRGTYVAGVSPFLDEGYSYRGFDKEMSRPAMVFDGAGHASIETERTFAATTFGMVAVFHPSRYSHYGIYASNEVDPEIGTPGEPLVFRYSHGVLDVFQAHVRVASYETHKSAHQAVILLVSLDAPNDEGRLMVVDSSRTSKQFNIDNLDFVSFGGMVGAEGQVTVDQPVTFTAEMDILEFGIWDTALSFEQLEEKANLLSLAYGVAG
jgi:hypothetical protein